MKYDIELLIDILRDFWLKSVRSMCKCDDRKCECSVITYGNLLSKYISIDENSLRIDAKNLLKYMQINGVPLDIEAIINEYILTYKI